MKKTAFIPKISSRHALAATAAIIALGVAADSLRPSQANAMTSPREATMSAPSDMMKSDKGIEMARSNYKAPKAAYNDPAEKGLPQIDMEIVRGRTAIVITDPQIDFLSPDGVSWGVVGESVTEHNVVDHLEDLMVLSKEEDIPLFISPHHYYPHDHEWKFEGALERVMHSINMFDRESPYKLDDFENSGSDFMPQYREYVHDGKTVITSPHKIYGPEQNDLALQLRKQGIDKVILAGMSANLCTQAHLYELIEQGFEVAVVRDATAGAIVPEGDGYEAALINFRFVSSGVWSTEETIARVKSAH